ncbi:inner nuclear membrane protein Man1 [Condylostylus longicornis]|uniref:inner nuclear membrane protein Man1 n=1 Tax=Condylostylus longicornis TaxID=2530218 RepID=UPI00244E5AF1|nr:inner nuclear membrane protein Man1 [Condylostylus longicornis]XP_055374219.1 inner nuclear membrane protein Man1 [Condylostylus longicornis]XP_055374220.1 inner nuclear membrane protein Man1 [Condylostylus longicornis]
MEDLESLSNNELRQYLLKCGFPNTPITDTTRKILIKRLQNHLKNKRVQLKKQIANVTRFSSDEESDFENRSQPEAYKRKTYNNNYNASGLSNFLGPQTSKNVHNSTYLNSRFWSSNTSSLTTNNALSINNNSALSYDKYKISPTSRVYISPTITYQDRNTEETDVYNNNDAYDASDSDADYISLPHQNRNNSINVHSDNDKSSYRSNFTRRLLNLRNETLASNKIQPKVLTPTEQNNFYVNHNPTSIAAGYRKSFSKEKRNTGDNVYDNLSPSIAFKNVITSLNEHYGVQQHFIPCTLVSVTVIFFIFLSFLYINITPNLISTVTEKNLKLNFCKTSEISQSPITHFKDSNNLQQNSITCIYKSQVTDALEVIKFIIPILQEKADIHHCKDETKSFSLNSRSAANLMYDKFLKNGRSTDIRKITYNLHNAEYLIANNPQWHISHVNEVGEILSYDQVIKLRGAKENYYAILNPSLPLFCTIYKKLQRFFFLIGSLALGCFVIAALYTVYKIITNYRQNKQQTVFHLVEEIINNLITKAERTPNEKSVVVNHLRDMLIPVHKRKELEWAWNQAITYLEQNESRILFEMNVINGENCQMIKWVDTVSPDCNTSFSENRNSYIVKKWESPAFIDKTNKIRNPPTPCLKIRQMFDKSEINDPNLIQVIHDSILEKVGLTCKIYDIQIDKQSCCVYVRCASEQDAGKVHDEINGWWFDKRLVSIKFLRLERYLTRFPNSSAGPNCLFPSNSKKLSISQCSTNLRDYNDDNDSDEDQT